MALDERKKKEQEKEEAEKRRREKIAKKQQEEKMNVDSEDNRVTELTDEEAEKLKIELEQVRIICYLSIYTGFAQSLKILKNYIFLGGPQKRTLTILMN